MKKIRILIVLLICLSMVCFGCGQSDRGWIYQPQKPNQKGIIYCHAGFISIKKDMEFSDVLNFSNHGFTVFVLKFQDERGNPPNPHRDRNDVKDAVTILKKKVPTLSEIFLVGVSRGGYVALQAFAYFPKDFKRCVAIVAPTDIENYDWTVLRQMYGDNEGFIKMVRDYFTQALPPLRLAEAGKYDGSRILLLYGGKDPICPPQHHCLPFAQKTGCQYVIYPEASHHVHRLAEAQLAAIKFMQE
ncbi:MAG: prolyl oligopeptidase family serine peptidase [Syntrophaceae bacterium]|nr:prolyl oligopeptidase family serine peptidase [Syntrophaceae bacterium]